MADDFTNLVDKADETLAEAQAKADAEKKSGPSKQRKIIIVVGFVVMLVANLAALIVRQNAEAEALRNSAIDIVTLVHEDLSAIYNLNGSLPESLDELGYSSIVDYQLLGDARYEVTPLLPAPYDVTVLMQADEPLNPELLLAPSN